MAFEALSQLFTGRDIRLESSDIQHGIQNFLQEELRSERVHCKILGASFRADIRVGSAALAEAVLIREGNIRRYAQSQLQCSLGEIRVMLDL
jgi:hypothetical protein